MRGKLICVGFSVLVLVGCALLAGTWLEKPLGLALGAAGLALMLVLSVLKLVAVYRNRHDERKRAQAIWSGRIDPL